LTQSGLVGSTVIGRPCTSPPAEYTRKFGCGARCTVIAICQPLAPEARNGLSLGSVGESG
jgi:hypothetical protein